MNDVMIEFAKRCVEGSLYHKPLTEIYVWIAPNIYFGNKPCVCYNGPLNEIETAEQFIIPSLSRDMPEARFVSVYPKPITALRVDHVHRL